MAVKIQGFLFLLFGLLSRQPPSYVYYEVNSYTYIA
jgi:hypothetical protein